MAAKLMAQYGGQPVKAKTGHRFQTASKTKPRKFKRDIIMSALSGEQTLSQFYLERL